VKAQDLPEIVFSRKRDFFKQIAQLDYVLEEVQRVKGDALVQSVNLTFDQVPVQLRADTPSSLLQPSQRKPKRELQ
jgi:cell division protein FtsQ